MMQARPDPARPRRTVRRFHASIGLSPQWLRRLIVMPVSAATIPIIHPHVLQDLDYLNSSINVNHNSYTVWQIFGLDRFNTIIAGYAYASYHIVSYGIDAQNEGLAHLLCLARPCELWHTSEQ